MPVDRENALERVEGLFRFLQGEVPKGCVIEAESVPRLTADQAWTVVWWLGNRYWQVPDIIRRCDVCGVLYNEERSGDVLDFGNAPYYFCDSCMDSDEYCDKEKLRQRIEKNQRKKAKAAIATKERRDV